MKTSEPRQDHAGAGHEAGDLSIVDAIAQLRRDEERLFLKRSALLAVNEAILISETGLFTDEAGPPVVYVNRAFSDLTGYGEEEVLGHPSLFLLGPKTDRDAIARLRQALGAGEPYSLEIVNYRKDGSEFWAEVKMKPLFNAQGVQTHWMTIRRDITARRRELAALQEREAMFRLMFEDNPLPMWVVDRGTFRFIEVNKAAISEYGWTREQFLARTVLEIRREEDHPAIIRSLTEPAAMSDRLGPWRGFRADGSELIVQLFSAPINYRGRPAVLRAAWDVTEMEQARAALVEREDRLRTVAATLQERSNELSDALRLAKLGTWRTDHRHGVPVWSDELCAMFGLAPGTIPRQRDGFLDLVHPDDREEVRAAVDRMRATKGSYTAEFRIRTPGGEIRHLVAHGRCILDADGEIAAVHGLCQDITERKNAEQALLRSEKLKLIGQVTGGVAHDFNNLLTIISLNIENVLEALPANDPNREELQEALQAASHGAELNSQLLSFAQRQALRPIVTDITEFLIPIKKMAERVLGEPYTVEYRPDGEAAMTRIDRAHLESAMLNLVINARDAMAGGGRIVFEVDRITIDQPYGLAQDELRPGSYVVISVSDNGVGMPQHVLDRVFEPFFTTKPTGQGTGLGLSMVLGFARQSNGHVTIYSEAGHGTTVKLYLPAHATAEAGAAETTVAPSWVPGPIRVLVVEDQRGVLASVSRLCQELGLEVTGAGSAEAALAVLRDDPGIALLFTDIVLPGAMSGVHLAEEARRLRSDIKILYTSGYSAGAMRQRGLLEADNEILGKPYRRIDLVNALYRLFGGS